MKRSVKGFTLIELMIVITIMAIIIALAVPAYQDYMIRGKVTECMTMAAVAKTSISEYRQTSAVWPPSQGAAGLGPFPDGNISSFCTIYDYNDGQGDFKVEVDAELVGATGLTIRPYFSPTLAFNDESGNVNWSCTFGDTSATAMKYLPSNCRADNIVSF